MSQEAAQVYAQSLFEVATDRDLVDAVGEDLSVVRTLLEQEPLLLTYLASPCFPLGQKQAFLIRLFGTELYSLTRRFLAVLLDRNGSERLPEILDGYQGLWDKERGIRPVRVTVARPLDAARRAQLEQDVIRALQGPVRLDVEIDHALLGGIRIRCEDVLIDNSLRGRLARATKKLNEQMKSVTYEG
jgi:ATP synthase F1 delta subunit